jgi:hypothetical protein
MNEMWSQGHAPADWVSNEGTHEVDKEGQSLEGQQGAAHTQHQNSHYPEQTWRIQTGVHAKSDVSRGVAEEEKNAEVPYFSHVNKVTDKNGNGASGGNAVGLAPHVGSDVKDSVVHVGIGDLQSGNQGG